jgi:hypothetical protein
MREQYVVPLSHLGKTFHVISFAGTGHTPKELGIYMRSDGAEGTRNFNADFMEGESSIMKSEPMPVQDDGTGTERFAVAILDTKNNNILFELVDAAAAASA